MTGKGDVIEYIPSLDQPYAIVHRLSISSVNNTGTDLMAAVGVVIVERFFLFV